MKDAITASILNCSNLNGRGCDERVLNGNFVVDRNGRCQ
jgi:hypothetical protein